MIGKNHKRFFRLVKMVLISFFKSNEKIEKGLTLEKEQSKL